MSESTAKKSNNVVSTLVTALVTAAAAWGSVSLKIDQAVDVRMDRMSYAMHRSLDSAAYRQQQRAQLEADTLWASFHQLMEHIDARLDTLHAGGRTVVRNVTLPAPPPDTAMMASQREVVDRLSTAVDMMAHELARQRHDYDQWREVLRKRGIVTEEPMKHGPDSH